jgi:hypothetical protein
MRRDVSNTPYANKDWVYLRQRDAESNVFQVCVIPARVHRNQLLEIIDFGGSFSLYPQPAAAYANGNALDADALDDPRTERYLRYDMLCAVCGQHLSPENRPEFTTQGTVQPFVDAALWDVSLLVDHLHFPPALMADIHASIEHLTSPARPVSDWPQLKLFGGAVEYRGELNADVDGQTPAPDLAELVPLNSIIVAKQIRVLRAPPSPAARRGPKRRRERPPEAAAEEEGPPRRRARRGQAPTDAVAPARMAVPPCVFCGGKATCREVGDGPYYCDRFCHWFHRGALEVVHPMALHRPAS